jgi:signal transduction histidine kinase
LNKELHKDQDLSGFSLLKALKSFESQDRTQNHDLYFIGVIEYTHPTVSEKYYFNVFFRANIIADIKWIEIFMYDITLNQRIEAIDQTIKLKEKILSKIAHEFKTPLICVISLSEKIQSELGVFSNYPNLRSEIKQINDLSNYTLLLINDIAFYLNTNSKSLDGVLTNINNSKFYKEINNEHKKYNQISLHKEDVNVVDILKFVFRILETLLVYKGNFNIKPLKDFKSNVADLVIHTDPLRLKQILLNLVSNAVKFTKSGYIKLNAKVNIDERFNRELEISVEDSGLGIKEEDYDKLFKDYKMLERHQNLNSMGSGLGLSISNQLAKLLGYEIRVKSEYTVGTTFSLIIKLQNYDYSSVSRKQSCPILTKNTTIKLNNCTFSKGAFESEALNIIESNKKTITRLLSGVINSNTTTYARRGKQRAGKNYLPLNANIVHISNSNFNFNTTSPHFDQEKRLDNIEIIPDHDSSSSEGDEEVRANSRADTEKTEERFIPVNMEDIRKMISFNNTTKYSVEDKEKENKIKVLSIPLQSLNSNKVGSSKSSSKKNVSPSIHYNTGIIIVDDNAMLLSSLKNVIKKVLVNNKINDVKIFCGSDGIDLLKILMDDQKGLNIVKCIFVDEFMEFMNGTEAIGIIREFEKLNKVRPLFIAKVSAMHFEQTCEGPNITLEKPVRDLQIQNVLKMAGVIKDSDAPC